MASLNTDLRSASASSAIMRTAARTSPPRIGAPERSRSASWVSARSARRTCRSSPLSMMSWPRATMRTSNSDSRVRRWSSLRPSRSPRSTSGASARRRVMVVVASLNVYRSLFPSLPRTREPSPRSLLLGKHDPDVELAQPLGRHRGGRAHHEVLGLLVHGEGDDLSEVALAGQQHHDAIDAGGRAPVGRGAVLERVQHAAEPGLHLLASVAGDGERLVHDVGPVVPNGAARELHPVADDVVLVGLDGQRILALQRLQAALGHREGIVAELDRPAVLVALEHREVGDPAEPERVLLEEVQLVAELD